MKYLLILIFLMGCSHRTRLVPKGCTGMGKYSETNADYKRIEEKIFFFGFEKEVFLKEVLADQKVDCRRVKYMNFTWKQTFFDSFVSLLPLITRKTLLIDYANE